MPSATLLLVLAAAQAASAPVASGQAASTQAPAPAATPAPASAAQPLVAAPSAPQGEGPTAEGLEALRHAYHDACEVRLYGEYDDMCSDLSDQIRRYRAALAKVERTRR